MKHFQVAQNISKYNLTLTESNSSEILDKLFLEHIEVKDVEKAIKKPAISDIFRG